MSSAEHYRKRDEMQKKAALAHAKWFASQSPAEQKRLAQMGLDKPPSDTDQVSGHSDRADPATSSRASTASFDVSSLDTYADQLAQCFDLDDVTATRIARHVQDRIQADRKQRNSGELNSVIGMLLRAENVKTCAAGLAYAVGLSDVNNFGPLRAYARRNGLSPAAISKQCIKWAALLNLPPSIHAKPTASRASFSKAQKEKHWRKKKFLAKPAASRCAPTLP